MQVNLIIVNSSEFQNFLPDRVKEKLPRTKLNLRTKYGLFVIHQRRLDCCYSPPPS